MTIFCSWLGFFLIQKENLVINLEQKIYMTVLKFKICEISLEKLLLIIIIMEIKKS